MGWRPRDVYAVTAEEFRAAWEGWKAVHCAPQTDEFATRDDLDELIAYHAAKYGS